MSPTRAGDGLTIAVVGLGKIGLPLAAQYAAKGHTVIGCDLDARVVELVNAGQSHVSGEPGLSVAVATAVAAGRLQATSDTRTAVAAVRVVVVIVPLIVDSH